MKNSPLSLVKIGNIKIGLKVNGLPVPTEKILITMASKEGEENFAVFPGTNKNGEDKVNVTLPFNKPELNFEISLVSFAQINGKDYIIRAEREEAEIFAIPLDDREEKPIYLGTATRELIDRYKLERTGLLRVMVEGISGFGEVFHFKTKSVHTIEAISNQLKMLSILTGKKLADMPLELKAYKRDNTQGEKFTFLSISAKDLSVIERQRERDLSYIKDFETLYVKSRKVTKEEARELSLTDVIDIYNKPDEGFVNINESNELTDIEKEVFAIKEELKIPKKIPLGTLVRLYEKLNKDKEKFKNFFLENKEDISLEKVLAKIVKLSLNQK